MEERIEPVKQGKLTSNITRFRQDKRLAVTGVLYSLSLIGMLACVVFGIVRYHESLRPENLSRLAAYVKAAGTMTDPFSLVLAVRQSTPFSIQAARTSAAGFSVSRPIIRPIPETPLMPLAPWKVLKR